MSNVSPKWVRPFTPTGEGHLTHSVGPVGGYLIGVAVAFFAHHPSLSPQWRLLVVTGFLGGLTTFSTFSAEVVTNLMEARPSWAFATVAAHLLGSLAMTLLGMGTVRLLRTMQF